MSMSRDGLLPKNFSSIHPKYKTPGFSTMLTGFFTGVPLLFLNFTVSNESYQYRNLFAFVLVCAGVLVMHHRRNVYFNEVKLAKSGRMPDFHGENAFPEGKFKVPYVNGKIIVPVLFISGWLAMFIFNKEGLLNFLQLKNPAQPDAGALKVFSENIPYWNFCSVFHCHHLVFLQAKSFTHSSFRIDIVHLPDVCIDG
jgi:hypothetical protein